MLEEIEREFEGILKRISITNKSLMKYLLENHLRLCNSSVCRSYKRS
jgi:hypothetical protein